MSRKCMITGKKALVGYNVSHANNKTKRRFLPSAQKVGIYSEALGCRVTLKISTAGLRTLEHKGGLDAYVMSTAITKLDPALRKIKTKVTKALAEKAA